MSSTPPAEVKGRGATADLWLAGRPGGDFQGYLQRDGYGVNGDLARARRGLQPVGCLALGR